jgi:hypothetical protein
MLSKHSTDERTDIRDFVPIPVYCYAHAGYWLPTRFVGCPIQVTLWICHMAPRDRIQEIVEIRQRSVKHVSSLSKFDLDHLADVWHQQLKQVEVADELVPIRIVTILEVFVRGWIEKLIDQGGPYVGRAAKLSAGLKFDFAIASSLHGGVVTLGQLIAHSVSISKLEMIASVFGVLLEEDLFASVSKVHDRWAVEVEGKLEAPIIADVDRLKRDLFRLFELRHILVHEMPRSKTCTANDIGDFLSSARLFVQALDEMLSARVLGRYPLNQREMDRDAADRSAVATEELLVLCKQIAQEDDSTAIDDVQDAWKQFAEAEAQRQADVYRGGSMEPMIYSTALEALTRSRIDELSRWIEEGKVE